MPADASRPDDAGNEESLEAMIEESRQLRHLSEAMVRRMMEIRQEIERLEKEGKESRPPGD